MSGYAIAYLVIQIVALFILVGWKDFAAAIGALIGWVVFTLPLLYLGGFFSPPC